MVYEIGVEYSALDAEPIRSTRDEARYKILGKKLEVAKENKLTFLFCVGLILGAGALMMWYGFRKWHKEIQPFQDEISRLNLLK